MRSDDRDILVLVKDLVKYHPAKASRGSGPAFTHAVDGVNLAIERGETLGLVGESGCGKTTLGKVLLGLLPATSGEVYFQGKNIFRASGREMRKLRRQIQIIFQDPYSSLNPRMTVGEIIGEPLLVHQVGNRASRERRVKELLDTVGLASWHYRRYPHEFSGGQRQRIGIARAIASNPKFVVCDEPVSALDVSIQSQVLNLLEDLQKELQLTYLFIAHNLSVVKHISDRVAVMYLGQLVEIAESADLYQSPQHPYTRALLSAIPQPDPELKMERIILRGDVPSPINPPSGCRFHTRCPVAMSLCAEIEPKLIETCPGHFAACHRAQKTNAL